MDEKPVRNSKRKIILLFSTIAIIILFVVLFGILAWKTFQSKPVYFLNIMFKNKLIGYVDSSLLKIDDVSQTLKVAPDIKGVVVQKKDGKYYYSVLGAINKQFEGKGVLNPKLDERVTLDISAKLATGQDIVVKFDNYITMVYWDTSRVDKDVDKFEVRSYFKKEGSNNYYLVDQGFLFLEVGDRVNLVWVSEKRPEEVLGKDSIIKSALLIMPPESILVD